MTDYAESIAQGALAAGLLDDGKLDAPPVAVKSTEAGESWRPWEPNKSDPWTDTANLRLASDPRGLTVAQALFAEGNISAEGFEAVRELWGKPSDHFYRIEDPSAALDVAAFYRERGLVDDDEFKGLCEGLANREVARERQEAARAEEQTRQDEERFDREQQTENQRAEIQQRATDIFYDKLDKLNGAQTTEAQ